MPILKSLVKLADRVGVAVAMRNALNEVVPFGRASALIEHRRATDFFKDAATGLMLPVPESYQLVDDPELVWNVITNSGRDFLHQQGYATSGLGANGLNFIGLSNDTLTETSASTTLSNEITINGLTRAAGTYAHTASTNTTTVSRVFTATGTQSAQKAALFTAVSAGTMNHALAFTQRNLVNTDTLTVTFTITLG